MTRTIGLLLLLGYCATTALAQAPPEAMEACSQVGDAAARLACFDREIQRRHAATAGITPAPLVRPKRVDDTIGLDGKQLRNRRKAQGIAPAAPTLIVAALRQLQPRPGRQYYFELDNGQLWESVDNQGQLLLGAHETVAIRSGVLGAFFLKTQGGTSIRVHRLR